MFVKQVITGLVAASLMNGSSVVESFTIHNNNAISSTKRTFITSLNAVESTSRSDFMKTMVTSAAALTLTPLVTSLPQPANAASVGDKIDLPSGVSYEILKVGDGNQPRVGELVGIRFKAFCGDNKIDDIFDTPEPYYTRIGAGGLLKGVEEVLPLMRVGDRYNLTIPGNLAFGPKGRPASAGKPRIPSNAVITFEVEMVGLPGREPELIDLIGDD